MKHHTFRRFASFVTLWVILFSFKPASASLVFSKGDWIIDITGNHCTASTATRVSGKVYQFFVVLDKQGNLPVQIMIRPKGQTPNTPGYTFTRDGQEFLFTRLPKNNNGTQYDGHTFWNLPVDTQKIISYIKQFNMIRIFSLSNGLELPFSLRGSSATVNELKRLCGQNSIFDSADFEKKFLPPEAFQVDIDSMTDQKAVELREVLAQAVTDYKEILAVQVELDELEARYKSWTDELASLNNSIEELEVQRLPFLKQEKKNAEDTIQQAKSERQQYLNLIDSEQQKLVPAQRDYEEAEAAIEPFVLEHDRLENQVRAKKLPVRNLKNRLENKQNQVTHSQQELRRLQQRADDLESRLQQLRNERRQARQRLDQAQNKLDNFDSDTEIRRRKQNNSELQQVKSRIQVLKQKIEDQKIVVQKKKQKRQRKKNKLDQCQAQAGADCTQQKEQLQQARQEFQQEKQKLENLKTRLANKQQRRKQIVDRIKTNVANKHEELKTNVRNRTRKLNQIKTQIQSLRQERQGIVQNDIPREENRLQQLKQEERQIARDLSDAEDGLDQAQREYRDYKQSVGYDQLEREVIRTRSIIREIEDTIAEYENEVQGRNRVIAEQNDYLESIIRDIRQTQQTIADQKERRIEVKRLLEPYEDEKAAIVRRLNEKKAILKETSDEYASLLP